MFIAVKNTKQFPQTEITQISQFLLSDNFLRQLSFDIASKDDDYTRKLVNIGDNLFLIRNSDFATVSSKPDELHIISHEVYGLLNMYAVGEDASKQSSLYWIVKGNALHVLHTDTGLLLKNTDINKDTPKLVGRFDGLWIATTRNSTVMAIDHGSTHVQT